MNEEPPTVEDLKKIDEKLHIIRTIIKKTDNEILLSRWHKTADRLLEQRFELWNRLEALS